MSLATLPRMMRVTGLTLLACLSMATSCVRFVTIEQRYSATPCPNAKAFLNEWKTDKSRLTARTDARCARPLRQDYLFEMRGKSPRDTGDARIRLEWSASSNGTCDLTLKVQFACRRAQSVQQCLELGLNGEPSLENSSVRASVQKLNEEIIPRLLNATGIKIRRSTSEAKISESDTPLQSGCD